MAQQIKLSARPRAERGRNAVKKTRSRGGVPAVIYGSRQEPQALEIDRREIERILAHAVGENLLVELSIEGDSSGAAKLSLIQQVQHDPIRGTVLHVDFHAVSATEEIEADIVLEPVGEADGVKNYGGVLQQHMHTLSVRCLPQYLPEVIRVDITHLKVGESLHVKDIPMPEGVSPAIDLELTAMIVTEPRVEVASTETATAPEVLKEKKAEGDDSK